MLLQAIKLPDEQRRAIRKNLLQPEALEQLLRGANAPTGPSGSKQQQQQQQLQQQQQQQQQQQNGSTAAVR